MPGDAANTRRLSAEDYLEAEAVAKEKHILWHGETFAMAGASVAHNRIVTALVATLGLALRGKPCEALSSDMRVWVPLAAGYVYPDVTVACAPLDIEVVAGVETLRNPRIILEVLSETTEAFDRGDKFDGYRSIPTLTDYFLLSSVRREVDHFVRQADGAWLLRAYRNGSFVPVASVGVSLSLDDVYERALPRPA